MQCYLVKFQSCLLGQLCNFEFLQDIIALFSKTVKPRNMKSFLHRVYKWVNIQKKFQVPRSHSIGEKCDLNCHLQVIIAFFSKNCATEEHEIFLHRVSIWVNVQKKFLVLVAQYRRKMWRYLQVIIFSNTVRPRYLKFFLYINPYGYSMQKNFMFLGRTVFERNAMITCRNSKLHNSPNKHFWNFTSLHIIFLRYFATEELEIFLDINP